VGGVGGGCVVVGVCGLGGCVVVGGCGGGGGGGGLSHSIEPHRE